jgi:flavodoxin
MDAQAKKILVVYYSRTGVTKKIAEAIAAELKGEVEEIIDAKDRQGLTGWLSGGRDATMRNLTEINPPQKSPAAYDLVIIGTPIWAWTMTPAVRAYMTQNKAALKNVAFFCTMGGSGDVGAFEAMSKIADKKPLALLSLLTKEVNEGKHAAKVAEFVKQLQG